MFVYLMQFDVSSPWLPMHLFLNLLRFGNSFSLSNIRFYIVFKSMGCKYAHIFIKWVWFILLMACIYSLVLKV